MGNKMKQETKQFVKAKRIAQYGRLAVIVVQLPIDVLEMKGGIK